MFNCCASDSSSRRSTSFMDSMSCNYVDLGSHLRSVVPIRCIGSHVITKDMLLVEFLACGRIEFLAGQFIGVHSHNIAKPFQAANVTSGVFTIVSPPILLPIVKFAVEKVKGQDTIEYTMYYKLKINDVLYIDKRGWGTVAITPRMLIQPNDGPRGICLISGGTAVMSHIPIIDELLANPDSQTIPKLTVIQSNRSESEIPFYKHLCSLAEEKKIDYVLRITGKVSGKYPKFSHAGRIDLDLLKSRIHCQRIFCVSGPDFMVESIIFMLLSIGVWPGSIRSDYSNSTDFQLPIRKDAHFGDSELTGEETALGKTNELTLKDATESEFFRNNKLDSIFSNILKDVASEQPSQPLHYCVNKLKLHINLNPETATLDLGSLSKAQTSTANQKNISPWLKNFLGALVGSKKEARIFVPLCQNNNDVFWLMEQGHIVIVSKLQQSQNSQRFRSLKTSRSILVNGVTVLNACSDYPKLFLSKSDIFSVNPGTIGGQVDCILDNGALDIVNASSEKAYFDLIIQLLKPKGKMICTTSVKLPLSNAATSSSKDRELKNAETSMRLHFERVTLLTIRKQKEKFSETHESVYLLEEPRQIMAVASVHMHDYEKSQTELF